MGYITEKQIADRLDLPVALPTTEVKRNNWLVVATFKIQSPMQLTFRYLQLQLVDFTTVGTSGVTLVESGKGMCYVGIFKNYDGTSPSGNPNLQGTLNDVVIASAAGVVSRNPDNASLVLTGGAVPESYSFVLVNNTTNTDIRANINGQIRLDLNIL